MTRWLVRGLVIAIVALLAVGSSFDPVRAAEGDYSLVPRAKLSKQPFRGITLVTVGDRVVCTGFVVSRRKVVTAGHCLVRNAAAGDYRLKPGLPNRLRVYRAYSRTMNVTPTATCPIARAWAHPKFVRGGRNDQVFGSRVHDYAVLTTARGCRFPRNAVLRLWGTRYGDGQLRTGQLIRTAGYPVHPRFAGMTGLNMWRTQGRIRPIGGADPRHLIFTGFVSSGMSGGPVWRTFQRDSPCGRKHCVVGIVTECAVNRRGLCKLGLSERVGVRITPQVKRLIKRK